MDKKPISRAGFDGLIKELKDLKEVQRQYIEDFINNADIIDVDSLSGDRVVFGARVVAEDEDGNRMQCRILSDVESDGKHVISCTSPMGRALIGRCVGDTCVVKLPAGEKEYEILEVKFKE